MKEGLKKEIRAFMVGILGLSLIVLCSGVFTTVGHADSTQQYNKLYLNPYVRPSMAANTNYTYMINVNPPDKISSVTSAIINFQIYTTPTVNFTLWINGQSCNTINFFVSTTYGGAGLYSPSFDCSNVINKAGQYNITLTSTKDASSSYAWIDLTYMNNPSGSAKISGTDYWQNERATVFLQLQDANGNAVNNASCNFDMYNTSNPLVSPIYYKQPMVFRGADGIYYYQFSTLGLPKGVYPVDAECTYIYDNYYFYTGVSPTINVTTNSGTLLGGSPFSLNSGSDAQYMQWNGVPNVTLRWDNVTSNITQLDFIFTMATSGSRTFSFYAKNKTSGNFQLIGSVVASGNGLNEPDLFTSPISLDYLNSTGSVSIQVVQTAGGGSTNVYFDWATLKAYKNSTYVTEVKGSSEVHIYPLNISDMPQLVWNYSTGRNLTWYNNTEIYNAILNTNSTIYNEVVAVNSTLSNLILNANSTISAKLNIIESELLNMNTTLYNEIASVNSTLPTAIWQVTTRELTNYNNTEIYKAILNTNSTLFSLGTLINGNLLAINQTTNSILNLINSNMLAINVTLPTSIWSYSSRTLTEYNTTNIYNVATTISNNLLAINVTLPSAIWQNPERNLTYTDWQTGGAFVWNSTIRELTNYNSTEIYNLLGIVNATTMQTNSNLANMNNTLYNILYNVSMANDNILYINGTLQGITNNITLMQNDLTGISTNITYVQSNLTQIISDLGSLNNTVYNMNASFTGSFSQLSLDLANMNATIIQINDTVNWINQSLVPNTVYIW